MTTRSVYSSDDAAVLLRGLSDAAKGAVHVSDRLAESVLRRAKRRRFIRRAAVGVGAGVVLLSTAAASLLGQGDFFTVRQPSQAMDPTVRMNERVVFSKVAEPQLGDMVYAHVTVQGARIDIMSRIMALPGDTIVCPPTPDGSCDAVLVNGQPVADAYLSELVVEPFDSTEVPDGSVFVLGDNRANAVDSRLTGPIPSGDISGIAVQIIDGEGQARAIPGAAAHSQPDGGDVVDPAERVPPAGTSEPQ